MTREQIRCERNVPRHAYSMEERIKHKQMIEKLVSGARKKLKSYASAETHSERHKSFAELGMSEGLFLILKLAALDSNRDRVIDDDEADEFEKESQEMVETHKSSLLNTAVVSALALSLVFPLAYR